MTVTEVGVYLEVAKLKMHRFACVGTPMPDHDWSAMLDDIGKHGVLHPILVNKDTVLDGYYRLKASKVHGNDVIPCKVVMLHPPDQLSCLMESAASHGWVQDSQRAMLAAHYYHPYVEVFDQKAILAVKHLSAVFHTTPTATRRAIHIFNSCHKMVQEVFLNGLTLSEAIEKGDPTSSYSLARKRESQKSYGKKKKPRKNESAQQLVDVLSPLIEAVQQQFNRPQYQQSVFAVNVEFRKLYDEFQSIKGTIQ